MSRDSLDKAIKSGVGNAIRNAAPLIVDTCMDIFWEHAWFPFIVGAQVRLIETGMKPRPAWELAKSTAIAFVRDEKVEFGDPKFDWGPSGGRDVIEAYEIEHWEPKS